MMMTPPPLYCPYHVAVSGRCERLPKVYGRGREVGDDRVPRAGGRQGQDAGLLVAGTGCCVDYSAITLLELME